MGVDGIERPYSIASSPFEDLIEVFFELVPKKYRTPLSLTPKIWELHEGDSVTMRQKAKGTFLLNESASYHGMIATVTGVAPFVSMMRAMKAGYYKNLVSENFSVYVFQGASYHDEFGYYDEMTELDWEFCNVIYAPTISRPSEKRNEKWQGLTGRVNAHCKFITERIPQTDGVIYLCGNEGMVDDLGNSKPAPNKPLGKFIEAGYRVKQEVFF